MDSIEDQDTSFNMLHASLTDTLSAFTCLQKCLQCRKCGQLCKELFTLGQCEHRFCWSCAHDRQGRMCPTCNMPSHATQARIDKQLSSVASFCLQMSDLLNTQNSPLVEQRKSDQSTAEHMVGVMPKRSRKNKSEVNTTLVQKSPKSEVNTTLVQKSPKSEVNTTLVQKSPKSKVKKTNTQKEVPKIEEHGGGGNINLSTDEKIQPNGDETANAEKKVPKTRRLCKVKENKPNASDLYNADLNSKTNVGTRRQDKVAQHLSLLVDTPPGKCLQTLQIAEGSTVKEEGDDRKTEKPTTKERRKSKTYLTKRNAKGETSLQIATIKADVETVRTLLQEGANPNVRDNAGWTPLHEAVNHGNVTIAELLINYGAAVNAPGLDNDTPLHDAVINYHLECVRLLVSRGANTLARNINGHTPLDKAQTDDMRDIMLTTSDTSLPASDLNTSMNQMKKPESGQPLCILGSVLSKDEQAVLLKCARLLNAKVVDDFSLEVSHLITSVNAERMCPRTLKYLSIVLTGKWVLNAEWLKACIDSGCRVPEDEFEIRGCTNNPGTMAPLKARQNWLSQLPNLFDGCQFYFHGKFHHPTPSREELASLVKLGGGIILTREPRLYNLDDYPYTIPFHAPPSSSLSDCSIFVIYDDTCPNPPYVEAQRMTYLPASWIMDSIASFCLLDKAAYLKRKS